MTDDLDATDLECITEELRALLHGKHGAREIRLLNTGSDRPGSTHWRFRTPDGSIATIRIDPEQPDEH